MLGARLKSWVEAQLGRARRRKHKNGSPDPAPSSRLPALPAHSSAPPAPLSSPESAYSTGYSTDGTSPGAPPDTRSLAVRHVPSPEPHPPPPPRPAAVPPLHHIYHEPTKRRGSCGHHRSDSGGWCRIAAPPVPVPGVAAARADDASATPSPRPRCRIRTNPWLGATPSPSAVRRRATQTPFAPVSHHASPIQHRHMPRGVRPRGGASSDEEGCGACGRETAILSDADLDTDADTGLDGGDEREPEDELDSPASRRRARRRRPQPRRPIPRSGGATPPRARRTRAAATHAPTVPPDPLLEADREAERKYRSLIREAERLLVSVSRAPLEPPHNPRVRYLRAAEGEPHRSPATSSPRYSPERTHLTNFIRANSPPAEAARRESPLARAPPPPPPPRQAPAQTIPHIPPPGDRPHSEPPKRKSYTRDLMLVQTLEGLKRSLEQQSALLATQTHVRRSPRLRVRLDSL